MQLRTSVLGKQLGLSVVELMVGMAIGMIVVAGALILFAGNVQNSRRLLVGARVTQDMRAAADVVARELRRAGYWENSIAGTVTTATGSTATANPNAAVAASAATSTITYSVARDTPAARCTTAPCTNNSMESDERFGFKLDGGILKMQVGLDASGASNWQPLTDSSIVTINSFAITPTETDLDVREACAKTCTGTSCPKVTVRSYALLLRGTSATDSGVSRVLQETIRVRNDSTTGTCPS